MQRRPHPRECSTPKCLLQRTVMRLAGSYSNIFCIRSTPSGHKRGNTCGCNSVWMVTTCCKCHRPLACKTHIVQVLRVPLRELVPVAQLGDARPNLLAGRPEQLEDVEQLLQFAVPREDGLLQAAEEQHARVTRHGGSGPGPGQLLQ